METAFPETGTRRVAQSADTMGAGQLIGVRSDLQCTVEYEYVLWSTLQYNFRTERQAPIGGHFETPEREMGGLAFMSLSYKYSYQHNHDCVINVRGAV